MTARLVKITVLTLVCFAFVVPAKANWLGDIWHSIVRDTKRRHCWPEPFVCPDRHDVRAPLALMVNNGWRSQNMLADHHFVEGTGELTEAGRRKVRWVLTEVPAERRIIYVHKAEEAKLTAERVDNTRKLAVKLRNGEDRLPLVLETGVPARGWPAAEVDLINRKFEATTPDPRLPAPQNETGE